jgi:hypothetical protein
MVVTAAAVLVVVRLAARRLSTAGRGAAGQRGTPTARLLVVAASLIVLVERWVSPGARGGVAAGGILQPMMELVLHRRAPRAPALRPS